MVVIVIVLLHQPNRMIAISRQRDRLSYLISHHYVFLYLDLSVHKGVTILCSSATEVVVRVFTRRGWVGMWRSCVG